MKIFLFLLLIPLILVSGKDLDKDGMDAKEVCSKVGNFRNRFNCSTYYYCQKVGEKAKLEKCPELFAFDNRNKTCNAKEWANCKEELQVSTTARPVLSHEATGMFDWDICQRVGNFKNRRDCSRFFFCAAPNQYPQSLVCPPGLEFDNRIRNCNYKNQAQCVPEFVTSPPWWTPGGATPRPTTPRPTTPRPPVTPRWTEHDLRGMYAWEFCNRIGVFKNRRDCSTYFFCMGAHIHPILQYCPAGLEFDNRIKTCNYKELAGCVPEFSTIPPWWTPDGRQTPSPTPPTRPWTPPPTRPPTRPPTPGWSEHDIRGMFDWDICQRIGVFKNRRDCSKFFFCVEVGRHPVLQYCPAGLEFDNRYKTCNYKEQANCVPEFSTIPPWWSPTPPRTPPTRPWTPPTRPWTPPTLPTPRPTLGPRPDNAPSLEHARTHGMHLNQLCPAEGLFKYIGHCDKFLQCGTYLGIPFVHNCPAGLQWDNIAKICNWPSIARCK